MERTAISSCPTAWKRGWIPKSRHRPSSRTKMALETPFEIETEVGCFSPASGALNGVMELLASF